MDSDEQHWEVVADYVAGGIRRGEKVLYFDGSRSSSPLLRRLREDNVDAAHLLRTGQLALFPPEVTDQFWTMRLPEVAAMVTNTIDGALAEGWPSVRITDEPAGAAKRPIGIPLADYDQVLDERMAGRPVTMLCQYEREHWSAAELTELRSHHSTEVLTPAIYDDGMLRITREAPFSTRAAGEIDMSNRALVRGIIDKELDRALRTAEHTDEIQLHLESLRFADVTTVTQFVQAAESFPQSHKLVLYGVQPSIRRVLERCGAGFTTQLTVLGELGR